MIDGQLNEIRDAHHRALSKLADDLRYLERSSKEAVAVAEARALEAERLAAIDRANSEQALRERDAALAKVKRTEEDAAKEVTRLTGKFDEAQAKFERQEPRVKEAETAVKDAEHEMSVMRRKVAQLERDLLVAADRIDIAEKGRAEAERHEGMFRRALFVYLQERDGPAGPNAPTPETLKLIRKLVDES